MDITEHTVAEMLQQKNDRIIKKLISQLGAKGIFFKDNDGEFNNVIFYNKEKEVRIHKNIFYRVSGISHIMKGSGDDMKYLPLSDEEFYDVYFKSILEMHFPEIAITKKKKEVIEHTTNIYGDDHFATPTPVEA